MKNFLKTIGSWFLWLYGLSTNAVTWIAGVDALKQKFSLIPSWAIDAIAIFNFIILLLLGVWVVMIVVDCLFLPYRKSIGTHGISCRLSAMFIFKHRNRTNSLLSMLHKDVYHEFVRIKDDIREGKLDTEEKQKKEIADYLSKITFAVNNAFKIDCVINIKVLKKSPHGNPVLQPYAHAMSNTYKKKSRKRNYNRPYIIIGEDDKTEDLRVYCIKASKYVEENGHKNYELNSVFNYLFSTEQTHWLTNDVMVDHINEKFYTSSNNYPTHYRSLGIFKIMPPVDAQETKGILIFDSEKDGLFCEEECQLCLGLISHFIYELFKEIEIYDKTDQSKNEKSTEENVEEH